MAGEGLWPAGSPHSSSHLLNGPLEITPCHVPKEGGWINEESAHTLRAVHVSTLEASPALTLLPWGTCLLQGCRLGQKRKEPWHHSVHMASCAWLSLGIPGMRMLHRMVTKITNSRKILCCWTATITRVSRKKPTWFQIHAGACIAHCQEYSIVLARSN